MPNTNLIKHSKTKSCPNFPILSVGKTKMCVTKHFTNLPLWCSIDEVAIINWLVYICKGDNTFEYSTNVLEAYKMSHVMAVEEYVGNTHLNFNLSYLRRLVLRLIEKGLLLQTGINNRIMINPMLCYNPGIISNKRYVEIMELYQHISPETVIDLTDKFSTLVKNFLEAKKKNYTYNK